MHRFLNQIIFESSQPVLKAIAWELGLQNGYIQVTRVLSHPDQARMNVSYETRTHPVRTKSRSIWDRKEQNWNIGDRLAHLGKLFYFSISYQ
ncbi:hypothetical protein P879_10323 [Paragonimus westermani]|uniref:Uncharacterized protein n=1 Tax=Paragonimus westermani TaxID=34504 RepID=A0A8T0DMQ3_9TREM|nr:hypothetical protein P879_10323 [Paragonimus westermani]